MSLFEKIARRFFWRPGGCVPSLEDLAVSDGLVAKWDAAAAMGLTDRQQPPLSVVELVGGKVVGDLRLVATREDVVIGGLQTIFGCDDPGNHYSLKRRRLLWPKYRPGTALLLGTANSDNYYHWMVESLPRWQMMVAVGRHAYDHVLLHSQPSPFQEETLDRLKVPPQKRLRLSKYSVHQFERLVVPAMPAPPWEVRPWACRWIDTLFPEPSSGSNHHCIYISRKNAPRRQLANEPELERHLADLGFACLQMEGLSVAEQIRIFRNAKCVVAPHGAALTNMVFAPPGATLLEMFHPQYKNNCYLNLAAACGHRYAGLDGHPIITVGARESGYAVDVHSVLEKLRQTL